LLAIDMMGARSKFIDDALIGSIKEKKVKQVVIIGAGLDGRSARLSCLQPSQGIKVYEVDFAAFLEAKRILFASIGFGGFYVNSDGTGSGASFVGTDLSESPERWQKDLVSKGFTPNLPTFWIIEGVTGYLKTEELTALLNAVSSFSSKGSLLAATWNGSTQNDKSAWKQDIHMSVVDNPDIFLGPMKWEKVKHTPVGKIVREYGITDSPLPANDTSYWLSLHSKA
jgi:methyltransferase (TIGR00027 family)